MFINALVSSQKLSVAEIPTEFRGVAAIWDPASVNEYLAGMTIRGELSITRVIIATSDLFTISPLQMLALSQSEYL
jgi:hypothetical protein